MTKAGWAIFAGVALFITQVLRGIQALRITLDGYSFDSVSLSDGTVGMYLYFKIVNPLWVGITLKEISGELTAVSDQTQQPEIIGTVYNRYNYFIRGNATHQVRAKIKVNAQSVIAATMQNVASGDINNLLLTFSGKLVFGGTKEVSLPIKRTMTFRELTGK